MPLGYGMVIARTVNRGGFSACIGAGRQGVSMSLTAKQQVTGENLAANRRNGLRLCGLLGAAAAPARWPNKTYEWLTEGRVHEYREGRRKKKNFPSETTKCMKTLGQLTKCHDKKAKIRRKLDLLFGHLRQSEANFAGREQGVRCRVSGVSRIEGGIALGRLAGTQLLQLVWQLRKCRCIRGC